MRRIATVLYALALSACTTNVATTPSPAATGIDRPATPGSSTSGSLLTILPGPTFGSEPHMDVLGAPAVLTPHGYNAIRIGSKLADAQKRYSLRTSLEEHFDDSCRLYTTPEVPGLLAYVQNGVVTRVSVSHVRLAAYVWVPPAVRTDRRIGVGSTEADVRAAYPGATGRSGEVSAPPDLYVGGTAAEPGLRFDFDQDRKVREISAGIMPALRLREGCL